MNSRFIMMCRSKMDRRSTVNRVFKTDRGSIMASVQNGSSVQISSELVYLVDYREEAIRRA